MPYRSNGTLTSSKLQIDDSDGWDTQTEWEAYQSKSNVEVVSGAVQLIFYDLPVTNGLRARYDATQLSLSDQDAVSTWADETGNGHDLTQTTSGSQPTYLASSINGNPVVDFDGSDDFMDVSWASLSESYDIFAVGRLNAAGSGNYEVLMDGASSSEFRFSSRNDSENANQWQLYQGGSPIHGSTDDANPHVFGLECHGSTDTIRVDGTQDASGDAGTASSTGLTVGAIGSGDLNGAWSVGEILFYERDLSDTERGDVESYLADKWGITI